MKSSTIVSMTITKKSHVSVFHTETNATPDQAMRAEIEIMDPFVAPNFSMWIRKVPKNFFVQDFLPKI